MISDVKGVCGMLEGNDGGGGLRFRSTSRGRSFCWIPKHHPVIVVGCSGASLGDRFEAQPDYDMLFGR